MIPTIDTLEAELKLLEQENAQAMKDAKLHMELHHQFAGVAKYTKMKHDQKSAQLAELRKASVVPTEEKRKGK